MTGSNVKSPLVPDTITAWQCIGCGRLEAPANCVGICQDRKVELVSAWDHAEALAALEDANERIAALEAVLKKFAHTTPRDGAWKDSYLVLQAQARKLVEPRNSEAMRAMTEVVE
jgi:hypothetical protein